MSDVVFYGILGLQMFLLVGTFIRRVASGRPPGTPFGVGWIVAETGDTLWAVQ